MKRKLYSILAFVLFAGFTIQTGFAQPSKGGTPPSFNFKTLSESFDIKDLPVPDVAALEAEDAVNNSKDAPFRAGVSIPVDVNMYNAGTWTELPDGNKIWRLKFTASGANGVVVYYDDFFIPEGGKLFLYNESKTQVIGAYTSENNPPEGLFATEAIQGETVTLEYVAPQHFKIKPDKQIKGIIKGNKIITTNQNNAYLNEVKPSISISQIAYIYRNVPFLQKYNPSKAPQWGSSDVCEVNVNCSPAGDSWQDEKRGVVEIWWNDGTSLNWCSGSLVNTTNNSGTPYFLTAFHCTGSVSTAILHTAEFYFKYESAACPNGSQPTPMTLTGCTHVASGPTTGGSDFDLLLLDNTPTQSYAPYYNGWDRTNTAWPATCVGIHHPAGDIKKISYSTSTLVSGGCLAGMPVGSAWNVNTWGPTGNGTGVTEGGSSGSPLFNAAGRIVGTLSGGASTCAAPTAGDCYGKFYYHWDLNGAANNQRLKPWLDPLGTNPNTVNGFDPFAGYPDFYGTPTTVYEGQTVNFTDLTVSATSWAWQFEGGNPATSTVQNPTNILYNQQGTYKVKLTTVTAVAGTQTMEKIGYITVLPGSPQA